MVLVHVRVRKFLYGLGRRHGDRPLVPCVVTGGRLIAIQKDSCTTGRLVYGGCVRVPSNDIVVAAPGVGGCPPSLTVYTALCRSDIHAIRGPLAPYSYNVPLLLVPSYSSRGWFREGESQLAIASVSALMKGVL